MLSYHEAVQIRPERLVLLVEVPMVKEPCLCCRAVPHQMLNARPQYVRREAKVIAQAGVPGVITLATSMAGRGVDVLMGGNPQGLAQMALEQLVFKRYLTGCAYSLSQKWHWQTGSSSPWFTYLLLPAFQQVHGIQGKSGLWSMRTFPATSMNSAAMRRCRRSCLPNYMAQSEGSR